MIPEKSIIANMYNILVTNISLAPEAPERLSQLCRMAMKA